MLETKCRCKNLLLRWVFFFGSTAELSRLAKIKYLEIEKKICSVNTTATVKCPIKNVKNTFLHMTEARHLHVRIFLVGRFHKSCGPPRVLGNRPNESTKRGH